jgi:hypothetical protein
MDRVLLEAELLREVFEQDEIDPRINIEIAELNEHIKEGYETNSPQFVNKEDYAYLAGSLAILEERIKAEREFLAAGKGWLVSTFDVSQAFTQYKEERSRIQDKLRFVQSMKHYIHGRNEKEVTARAKAKGISREYIRSLPLGLLQNDIVVLVISGEEYVGKIHCVSMGRDELIDVQLFCKKKDGDWRSHVSFFNRVRVADIKIVQHVKQNEAWQYLNPVLAKLEEEVVI